MKSVSESYLGLRCIVETESASLFASQVESRPLSDKVWFFVYIPQFFLQSLVKKLIRKNAYVLVDSCEDDPVVQQLNDSAKALGVCKDMPLSLIDKLGNVKIFSRDKEREKNAIDDLLVWANKFSPLIVDKFPDGLLVEMKGSLKLFGGQEKLIKIMSDELQIRGYKFNLAIGLTPLLAEISAKIGWKGDISNRFAYKKINNVPISVLSFLPKQFDVLNKMGVRTLGDCQKLPRKGLAERFGKDIMLQFDRLYGYSPDPQTFFTAVSKKSILMAIDGDVGNWSELKFHIKKLIKKTNKYLLSRSLKVRRATWFFYGPSFEVNVPISLSSANNISVVLRILQEKLRDKRFKGPIDSVRLFLDEVENTRPANLNIL